MKRVLKSISKIAWTTTFEGFFRRLEKGAALWLAICLLGSRSLLAAAPSTLTWDGGGSDNNINTVTNWNPNLAPGNGDFLIFDGSVRTLPQLTAALTAGSITFNSTAAAFTIGGSQIFSISSGGIINNSINDQTFNTPLKLSTAQTWMASAGNLILSGALDKNGKALIIDGSFNTTLAGAVSGGGTFTKNGTGTLTLSGAAANTYSAATTVNAGTLVLSKTAGLNAMAV